MKIISHRGNGGKNKENTKESVLEMLNEDFVDGVEIDIRMTVDHKFVLCHNPFYEGKLISLTKYKKIKQLDNLENLLKNIQSQKIIMLDIKEEIGKYKLVVYYLYKILKKYNLNLYVCSFNHNLMNHFLKKHPNITNGLIIGMKLNEDKIKNDFDFNSLNYKCINKITPKETFAWTINNKSGLKNIPDNCNIITDNPKEIYNIIHE